MNALPAKGENVSFEYEPYSLTSFGGGSVPQIGLSLAEQRAMLDGFSALGYTFASQPNNQTNPLRIVWNTPQGVRRFRLWAFLITGGGGGPTVRSADEFRIQITNGPSSIANLDQGGAIDLVLGYVPSKNTIVAYDRRWMESWLESGSNSPSIQVKEADIDAAATEGFHRLTKETKLFQNGRIVTMRASLLPAYLLNPEGLLMGSADLNAAQNAAEIGANASPSLKEFCQSRGFTFSEEMLARYVASLITKPFVILAGVSGTGKSKMAELVAEFYSALSGGPVSSSPAALGGDQYVIVPQRGAPDPTRFALVPVRPDWIDNQSVFGYVNPLTNRYESTVALDLILRAQRAIGQAESPLAAPRFFMLLDEMNLARVEHYFSDWLACTESRRLDAAGAIRQQPVPLYRGPVMNTEILSGNTTEQWPIPQQLSLPTNLVVTGTVNVDETTYGFSPKVLDRAMVIEFDEVRLDALRGSNSSSPNTEQAFSIPEFLQEFRLATQEDYAAIPLETHEHLKKINGILEKARLHFGYRSANEIARFLTVYNGMLPESENDPSMLRALDIALLQKILPRVQGNRAKLERPLERLCFYLRNLELPIEGSSLVAEDTATARLPRSYGRAIEMLAAVREFGFVSFFK